MENDDVKIDVEQVIEEIRSAADRAEDNLADGFNESIVKEQAIYANLKGMNESCHVGAKATGRMGLLRKFMYLTIAPLISEINSFHAHTVRVMNQMVRAMEGDDSTFSGEMAEKLNKRIELLSQLSQRLEEYDQLGIEQRLDSLEKQIESLKKDQG